MYRVLVKSTLKCGKEEEQKQAARDHVPARVKGKGLADMQWNVRPQRRQECREPPVFTLINILLKLVPQNAGKAKVGLQERAA